MKIEDSAIKYNTCYNQVKSRIEKLKSINIDIAKLEIELDIINKEVEENVNSTNITTNNFGIEVYYQMGISKLNDLLRIIDNYNEYYKMSNLIKLLKVRLKESNNFTATELNIYVEEVKNHLDNIISSSTIKYSDEEEIINDLYDLAYLLINKEILLSNSSELLEDIQNNDIHKEKLNIVIKKDLENIDLDNNAEIQTRILELDSKGIDATYVDLKLLSLIAKYNFESKIEVVETPLDNKDIINEDYEMLKSNANEYTLNKDSIEDKKIQISHLEKETSEFKNKIKKYKTKIGTRVVSCVLALSGLVTINIVSTAKLSRVKLYKTEVTTYIQGDNNKTTEEQYEKEIDNQYQIMLKELLPYEIDPADKFSYKRKEYWYNLSNIKLDNELDYFNVNLQEKPSTIEFSEVPKIKMTESDFYAENIKKLEIRKQNLEDYIYEHDEYSMLLCIVLWALADSFLFIAMMLFNIDSNNKIRAYMDFYQEKIDGCKKTKEELFKDIKNLINKNDELKNSFNRSFDRAIKKFGYKKELGDLYYEVNGVEYNNETIEVNKNYYIPKKKELIR